MAVGLVGALSSAGQSPASDREQLTQLITLGQRALGLDHPEVTCRLMTRRARRLSHRFLYTPDGAGGFERYRGPHPTCTRALAHELRAAKGNFNAEQDFARLRGVPELRIRRLTRTHARVTVVAFDYTIDFRRTSTGWRADSSDSFPFDGSSGE